MHVLSMALLAGVQHMKNHKRADIKPAGDEFVRSVDLLTGDNEKFHQLGHIVDNLLKSKIPGYADEPGKLSIQCNYNQRMNKHIDKINLGHSYIFAVGDYSDGELQVYDGDQPIDYDIRSKILKFDGQTPHGVARIGSGVRISFVVYRRNA